MNDRRRNHDVPITVIVSRMLVIATIAVTFFCAINVSAFATGMAFVTVILSFIALRIAESADKKEDRPS